MSNITTTKIFFIKKTHFTLIGIIYFSFSNLKF